MSEQSSEVSTTWVQTDYLPDMKTQNHIMKKK